MNYSCVQSFATLGGTGKKTGERHPKVRKGVLIAADAINRAKSTDADKLVDALEKTNFVGTRGTVKFGTQKGGAEHHQWMPPMLVIQWQSKQQVVLYPPEAATGKLLR